VGVTQLPFDVSNKEIEDLSHMGVRALRFNLFRGNSRDSLSSSSDKRTFEKNISQMLSLAQRAGSIANWHAEFYVDAQQLEPYTTHLTQLPRPIVIDHLGMTTAGLPTTLQLVSAGAKVKATGFGRVQVLFISILTSVAVC
jgi:hypothetical protein